MDINEIKKRNDYYERLFNEVKEETHMEKEIKTLPPEEIKVEEMLFRCSSLATLMTEPKSKTIYYCAGKEITTAKYNKFIDTAIATGDFSPLSHLSCETIKPTETDLPDGVISHIVDAYTTKKYNRFEEIHTNILSKGNEVEEDAITMVSLMNKKFFKKNEDRIKNDYIIGTPDLFEGPSIHEATAIRDTKSAWSVFTFTRHKNKPLPKEYYWQGQGYMELTGAKVCYFDFCLLNTPYHIVESEIRKQSYKYKNMEMPVWMQIQIIANHVYDKKTFNEYIEELGFRTTNFDNDASIVYAGFVEIPMADRYYSIEIKHNQEDIDMLYKRIELCRQHIKENLS
jgi:hypothetical protein